MMRAAHADVEVSPDDVRDAAAAVVRAVLGVRSEGSRARRLHIGAGEHGSVARLDGEEQTTPVDVGVAVEWLRALGDAPLAWDLRDAFVSLRLCGVTVWTAGSRTAATFGLALSLPLEHGGVFFGEEAPFEGASPTALVPEGHPDEPTVHLLAYTRRRYGLQLQEVGRVPVRAAEFRALHRQLLGLLRALTLEQPQAAGALRTLEALGR